MAKNRTEVVHSEADQQEIASRDLPYAQAVLDGGFTAHGTTPGGQPITARVGLMNESAGRQQGRPFDATYASLTKSIRQRHEATGVTPCTILNYLPIPLVVNSPMQDLKVRIPAAPMSSKNSDLFSFYTWYDAAIEVMARGEGINQPWDFMPVQIAQAFMDEYASFGGVVLLRGIPDEATLSKPAVVMEIEAAREKMIAWMLTKVEEANGEWHTANHSGARNIVELHRTCATRLKDLGLIDELPEWMVAARELKEVTKKCGSCATQPLPGAIECANCHWILDPAKAYIANIINEESDALERLTRAEVVDLGVSAFVSETSDEKPARVARGDAKPMSIAQRRAMAAEQQIEPPVERQEKATVPAL